jgi:hypothetical protein
MADWVPVAGSTFLVPSGPSGYHLHVVLNDPCVFDGYGPVCCVVMVGFTSKVNGAPYDSACNLVAGDHPFINHDSYIAYKYARVDRIDELEKKVTTKLFIPREPVSAELLYRIRNGLQSSRFASREMKRLLTNL